LLNRPRNGGDLSKKKEIILGKQKHTTTASKENNRKGSIYDAGGARSCLTHEQGYETRDHTEGGLRGGAEHRGEIVCYNQSEKLRKKKNPRKSQEIAKGASWGFEKWTTVRAGHTKEVHFMK